jgi:hypothetical protein
MRRRNGGGDWVWELRGTGPRPASARQTDDVEAAFSRLGCEEQTIGADSGITEVTHYTPVYEPVAKPTFFDRVIRKMKFA